MLSRAISVLLATTIVACPCFCKWGGARPSSDRAEVHSCCCCSHSPPPSHSAGEHPTVPDPAGKHSGECCQCICGGAVVEDAPALDIGFDASWAVPPPSVVSNFVQTQGELFRHIAAEPPPDVGGMNPGRVLCCRYMSFLC